MCYCIGDCSCAEGRLAHLFLRVVDGSRALDPPDPEKILPKKLVAFATFDSEVEKKD